MNHFALLIEALGIAPNAAESGYPIDTVLEMLHWFMLFLFLGWGGFYAFLLWKFQKKKNPKAQYFGVVSHFPTKVEGGILVFELVIMLSFAAPIWARRVDQFPTGPDVTHLRAVGQQYLWTFQYSGPDGKFGRRDPKLITASNQLGLDRKDPDAFDDLVSTGEMHVPVDHPVIIDVMSKDVIHDLCIPNMRAAQDAIPGMIIPVWFTPNKTGTYEIVCAQLCGANHSAMKGILVVESMADYKKWFQETAKSSGATALELSTLSPAPLSPPVPVGPEVAALGKR